jgi:hypothetical protein
MPDITITCKGVVNLLLNLNSSKVAGSDELKHCFKEFTNEIAPFLTIICQKSLNTGAITNDWKTTHHVSIYEKVLSTFMKIIDRFL